MTRRVGFAVRLCAVILAAGAVALTGCGSDESTQKGGRPLAGGPPSAPIAALEGPRTAKDEWPVGVTDEPLTLDRDAGRRLTIAASRGYGLWLAPTLPPVQEGGLITMPDVPKTCLRVIPLAGPDRGGGGAACVPTRRFVRNPQIVHILTGGSRGIPGVAAPHEAVIAGVVPDGVPSVRLETSDGDDLVQRVESNAFVFHTTRIVNRLTYRTPNRLVRRRLYTCQTCPLGAPTAPGPPGAGAPG